MKLPEYKCHKVVQAAKIIEIIEYMVHQMGDPMPSVANRLRLELPDDSELARYGYSRTVNVTDEWMVRFKPEVGQYYVVYRDGYASVSPAMEFEDGYERLVDLREEKLRNDRLIERARPNEPPTIAPVPLHERVEVYGLKVKNRRDEVVLVLGENGEILHASEDLGIANNIPERIVAAAAGGLDITNIPTNAEVVFLGHVQLDSVGWESNIGHWMTLQIPKAQFDEQLREVDPDSLNIDLEVNMSTLQCLLIRGDLVHRQGEPPADESEDLNVSQQAFLAGVPHEQFYGPQPGDPDSPERFDWCSRLPIVDSRLFTNEGERCVLVEWEPRSMDTQYFIDPNSQGWLVFKTAEDSWVRMQEMIL